MFDTKKRFRIMFLLGLTLLFASLFLEWYIFQAYNSDHKLVAYWSYNPITGWSTIFSENSTLNYFLKPNTFQIPIVITGVYVIVLLVSAYSVLFRDVEQNQEIEKLYKYAYANIFLLMLILYYIFAFPLFYLMPNDLYFPFVLIKDKQLDVTYYYSVGPGYCVQIIGFIMVFPYTMLYYNTVTRFKSKNYSMQQEADNYLRVNQEPLDLDKLIAKEQLSMKYESDAFEELEDLNIYQKSPMKRRIVP